MSRKGMYKISKGKVYFRREMEFKTIFHEIAWKIQMKLRGFTVENMK